MAKVDIKSFRVRGKDKPEKTPEQQEAKAKEKATASPMLGRAGNRTGAVRKAERKLMRMPVTKNEVELTVMSVDASECVIHPKNRRIQKLLRESNPKVMDLKKSMEEEGQRDPVLSRFIEVDGERKIEVIDGSRRRFVSDLIAKENPDFKLKVWIGKNISDVDAEYLTRVENEFQEAISPWETAVYIKSVLDDNPDWTQEMLAMNEGISRTKVWDYIQLAAVPFQLVELLDSPDALALKSGKQIAKLFEGASPVEIEETLKVLSGEALFASSDELVKKLKESQSNKSIKKPTVRNKVEIKSGEKVRADIGKNRNIAGQYKLNLYEVTDKEYGELTEALAKILGK